MLANWLGLGFQDPPTRSSALGGERLFRVHGGAARRLGTAGGRGVFFSLDRPRSRREAERLFAVAEYGNALLYLSEFRVPTGTPMWLGRVHPGDAPMPGWNRGGSQVFVEQPWAMHVLCVATTRLSDDMPGVWVHWGPAGNA